MKRLVLLISAVISPCAGLTPAYGQAAVLVSANKTVRQGVNRGASSANLCWLLDSDRHRPDKAVSIRSALRRHGAGSLRFPYGHLADNYLWDSGGRDSDGALRPAIASMHTQPANWQWAVNPDGTFINAMDFDEYISLCRSLDIKPLVVVNALSFKYKGGPSVDRLAESAADWAAYAKENGCDVAYWQIGNEIDHHPELITKREYLDAYKKIASAMKEADPQAKIGPGILSRTDFFDMLVDEVPELIDFTTCHQYMWMCKNSFKNYTDWLGVTRSFIPNVKKMQEAVDESGRNMEILVTETGITGSGLKHNDVWAGIWWFEVLMEELHTPHVAYSYFWGTHSPWAGGKDNDEDIGVLFRVEDNSFKPIAQISALVNANLHSDLLQTCSDNRLVKAYSSMDKDTGALCVFLLNKSPEFQKTVLKIEGVRRNLKSMSVSGLYGLSSDERNFHSFKKTRLKFKDDLIHLELPPYSILVVK